MNFGTFGRILNTNVAYFFDREAYRKSQAREYLSRLNSEAKRVMDDFMNVYKRSSYGIHEGFSNQPEGGFDSRSDLCCKIDNTTEHFLRMLEGFSVCMGVEEKEAAAMTKMPEPKRVGSNEFFSYTGKEISHIYFSAVELGLFGVAANELRDLTGCWERNGLSELADASEVAIKRLDALEKEGEAVRKAIGKK